MSSKPTLPLFDSGDPTLGDKASELFGEGEDVNADLVGKTITLADREWTVHGSPPWSNNYVILVAAGEPGSGIIDSLCRPAGLVRRHLQLAA